VTTIRYSAPRRADASASDLQILYLVDTSSHPDVHARATAEMSRRMQAGLWGRTLGAGRAAARPVTISVSEPVSLSETGVRDIRGGVTVNPQGEEEMTQYGIHQTGMKEGDDLRDYAALLAGGNPVTDEFGATDLFDRDAPPVSQTVAVGAIVITLTALLARLAPALRVPVEAAVRSAMVAGRASVAGMPSWVGTALRLAGITAAVITVESAFDDGNPLLPDIFERSNNLPAIPGQVTTDMHNHVVGSWEANGVTFYRLMDGKIAVQNKKGRWKVWRPKKPIILYSDGASSLKNFLKADVALDKQAKKLRKALDRRAPRRQRTPKAATAVAVRPGVQVIDTGGH